MSTLQYDTVRFIPNWFATTSLVDSEAVRFNISAPGKEGRPMAEAEHALLLLLVG